MSDFKEQPKSNDEASHCYVVLSKLGMTPKIKTPINGTDEAMAELIVQALLHFPDWECQLLYAVFGSRVKRWHRIR